MNLKGYIAAVNAYCTPGTQPGMVELVAKCGCVLDLSFPRILARHNAGFIHRTPRDVENRRILMFLLRHARGPAGVRYSYPELAAALGRSTAYSTLIDAVRLARRQLEAGSASSTPDPFAVRVARAIEDLRGLGVPVHIPHVPLKRGEAA